MEREQLKPNVVIRGPIFPEPVQVIVTVSLGEAVKVIAKGLRTGQVHEPVLARTHEKMQSFCISARECRRMQNPRGRPPRRGGHVAHAPAGAEEAVQGLVNGRVRHDIS
jgi:hypothetical protein